MVNGDVIGDGAELLYAPPGARPDQTPAQPPEVMVNGVPADGEVRDVLVAARLAERAREAAIVAGLTGPVEL